MKKRSSLVLSPQMERLINRFGSGWRMAKVLGLPPSTIQRWKTSGFVPEPRREELILKALDQGIIVDPADFVAHLYVAVERHINDREQKLAATRAKELEDAA
jgi:hypothetical protein